MATILLIELILLFLLVFNKNNDIRRSIIIACVLWAIILVLFTEMLSLMNGLTQRNLSILWIISIIISSYLLIKQVPVKLQVSFSSTLDNRDKIVAYIITIFIVATFLSAVLFPPRNWDSMTYHMARVANWAQNHSVHHYATHIPRQLFSGVYAEYIILNTYLLNGNDNLANIVQWFYYISSIILVSTIAKKLGLSKKSQLLAAVLYAAMPMVVMQASTTQNDLTAAFWTLAFVYFTLDILRVKKLDFSLDNVFLLFMLSSCLGLGLMTKATSCLAILPFLLWILIDILKKKNSVKSIFSYASIALIIITTINLGYFWENQKTSGSLLASSQNNSVMVDTLSPKLLFVNILKNIFMELDFDLKDQEGNKIFEHFASNVMGNIGEALNVNINEPGITWQNIPFSLVTGVYHEDVSGNPWLMVFSIISISIILINAIKSRTINKLLIYSIASFFSFLILSLSIKWQPWITRLLTPSMALLSLVPVMALESFFKLKSLKKLFVILIISVTLIGSMQPLLLQRGQPLLLGGLLSADEKVSSVAGQKILKYLEHYDPSYSEVFNDFKDDPNFLYFFNRRSEYIPYKRLINFVKANDYKDIGLIIGGDSYEYPIWVYLKTPETIIKHVNVTNISKIYEAPSYIPECIIVINNNFYKGDDKVLYHNQEYVKAYAYDVNNYLYVLKSKFHAPFYNLGETINFNTKSKYQLEGWSNPEDWGTWTDGPKANLSMSIKSETEELFLHLDIIDIFTALPVEVLVNNEPVGFYKFSKGSNTIQLPKSVVSSEGNVNIVFKIKDPQSPKSLGISVDERELGIGVKSFSITNSK